MYKKRDHIAYPPRGLNRDDAVRYIGLGAATFDSMVNDGRMPRPKKIDDRLIWDRDALDAAFTALVSDSNPPVARRMPIDRTSRGMEAPFPEHASSSVESKGEGKIVFDKDIETLLRIKEVREMTKLATATIYRKMKDGTFPLPRNLGGNTVRWRMSEVQKWIADLLSERETKTHALNAPEHKDD
ncbi:helix-turn-helix transcriptional regulator [Pararhizobium gei]|uniref:helix-turn-helix transcriptional regulator n=1 Tax=Pararhizobium gei TaxID=1395951 RepID=UPI003D9C6A3A